MVKHDVCEVESSRFESNKNVYLFVALWPTDKEMIAFWTLQ